MVKERAGKHLMHFECKRKSLCSPRDHMYMGASLLLVGKADMIMLEIKCGMKQLIVYSTSRMNLLLLSASSVLDGMSAF